MGGKKIGIWADFRMSLRLMRYSMNFKLNIAVSLLFTLLGVMISVIDMEQAYYAAVYFLLGPLVAAQMIYGLNVSNMVNASPLSKKLQIDFPILANLMMTLAGYTVLLIIAVAGGHMQGIRFAELLESGQGRLRTLMLMAIMAFLYLIYIAFAYKYSIASMIVFMACYFALIGFTMWNMSGVLIGKINDNLRLPVPVIIAAGYVLIIAGSALSYFFSKLIYRKDFSRRSLKMISQEMY